MPMSAITVEEQAEADSLEVRGIIWKNVEPENPPLKKKKKKKKK